MAIKSRHDAVPCLTVTFPWRDGDDRAHTRVRRRKPNAVRAARQPLLTRSGRRRGPIVSPWSRRSRTRRVGIIGPTYRTSRRLRFAEYWCTHAERLRRALPLGRHIDNVAVTNGALPSGRGDRTAAWSRPIHGTHPQPDRKPHRRQPARCACGHEWHLDWWFASPRAGATSAVCTPSRRVLTVRHGHLGLRLERSLLGRGFERSAVRLLRSDPPGRGR